MLCLARAFDDEFGVTVLRGDAFERGREQLGKVVFQVGISMLFFVKT